MPLTGRLDLLGRLLLLLRFCRVSTTRRQREIQLHYCTFIVVVVVVFIILVDVVVVCTHQRRKVISEHLLLITSSHSLAQAVPLSKLRVIAMIEKRWPPRVTSVFEFPFSLGVSNQPGSPAFGPKERYGVDSSLSGRHFDFLFNIERLRWMRWCWTVYSSYTGLHVET
jgi:hypothetical protein